MVVECVRAKTCGAVRCAVLRCESRLCQSCVIASSSNFACVCAVLRCELCLRRFLRSAAVLNRVCHESYNSLNDTVIKISHTTAYTTL